MAKRTDKEGYASSLQENLKKALTETLVLKLLSQRDYFIGDLMTAIRDGSGGALEVVFPYGAIYRLCRGGYITESQKRNAPDGRLRQYYRITNPGKKYLAQQLAIYHSFIGGVNRILDPEESK